MYLVYNLYSICRIVYNNPKLTLHQICNIRDILQTSIEAFNKQRSYRILMLDELMF